MSSTPDIRFNGFIKPWEHRKFSDLAETRRGLTYSPTDIRDNGVRVLRSSNIAEDQFAIGEEDVFVDSHTINIPYVKNGDILITAANGSTRLVGKHAIIKEIPDNSAVHGGFMLLASANNPEFVNALMGASWYAKFISLYVAGGNGAIGNLNKNDLDKQYVLVPDDKEQKEIGDYFLRLDNLITLHQRKYDEMSEIKKFMLQKMFPKNGEQFPEIRFSGFAEPWEQRKLGDVIDKLTGGASIAPDDYVEEGYRTIPKGAVNDTGVADMSGCKVVTEEFFEKNKSSKTSTGELVTSLRDLIPTAPNMGRIVRICGKSEVFLMPQGVYSIIVKEKIDEDFLIAYSNSPEYRKIIMMEKNGSTQVHIRNGEFLDIDIPLPTYSEQKKIGTAINNLDNLIALHQRKCDELKDIKKYMLQNMFPKKG